MHIQVPEYLASIDHLTADAAASQAYSIELQIQLESVLKDKETCLKELEVKELEDPDNLTQS